MGYIESRSVLILFPSKEKEFALKLTEKLEENNIPFEPLDADIDRIYRKLATNTKHSFYILIVATKDFPHKREFGFNDFALLRNSLSHNSTHIRILPIIREKDALHNLPFYLKGLYCIKMMDDEQFEQNISHLIRSIEFESKKPLEVIEEIKKDPIYDNVQVKSFVDQISKTVEYQEKQNKMLKTILAYTGFLVEAFQDTLLTIDELTELQTQFNNLLKHDCSNITNTDELTRCRQNKGKALEVFCKLFFSKAKDITFLEMNRQFEYEEIDLIFENNSREPFLMNLLSPLIFVECKNWSSTISAKEGVWFNNKLLKRKGLAKLGIFIALNDFKQSFEKEIEFVQREGFVVAILSKEDFLDFFNEKKPSVIAFIKKKILESIY